MQNLVTYDEQPVFKTSYNLLVDIFSLIKENANLLMQWIFLISFLKALINQLRQNH